MKLTTLLALPVVLLAQTFTLIITHKDGSKTEIPTSEISSMDFREELPPSAIQLATPTLRLSSSDNVYTVQWYPVEDASAYEWRLDNGQATRTNEHAVKLQNLAEGQHEVGVKAIASTEGYIDSEEATIAINVEFSYKLAVTAKEKTSATVSFSCNGERNYIAGIVPASAATDRNAIVAYINTETTAQAKTFTTSPTQASNFTFTDLTADTEYVVAVFTQETATDFYQTKVRTNADLKPGQNGSVFPDGVSAEGGWIDVDKVGNLSQYGWSGSDSPLCWATTATGMLQWWMNDYKSKTGHDYATVHPIPETSKAYSTPIMDIMLNSHNISEHGGSVEDFILWFMSGVEYNVTMNGIKLYNDSYPYWKGGFLGMTEKEAKSYLNVRADADPLNPDMYLFNRGGSVKGMNASQTTAKFGEIFVEALKMGPVYVNYGGSHALSCWGADYTVLTDGTIQINELYIGENDMLSHNVKNGMNKAVMTYDAGKVYMSMPNVGRKELTIAIGIKGYGNN